MLPQCDQCMLLSERKTYATHALYRAATAIKRAPTALMKEPETELAAPVATAAALVVGLEPEWVTVARLDDDPVPTGPVLLLPEAPVGEGDDLVVMAVATMPLPAPSDGDRPLPEETVPSELAAETRDDPALAAGGEADTDVVDEALPIGIAAMLEGGAGIEVEDPLLDELEEAGETSLQDRSYRGVVLEELPMMPKLGFGVTGLASCRVNHQVLTTPKLGHPTSSQYVLAFARLGTARFSVFPLTGHPVSVIQISLLPTTFCVAAIAALNKLFPLSMLFAIVFWKYGYASTPMKLLLPMTQSRLGSLDSALECVNRGMPKHESQ